DVDASAVGCYLVGVQAGAGASGVVFAGVGPAGGGHELEPGAAVAARGVLLAVRGDPRRASGLLAQALSLWHGPALAGVGAPFAVGAAGRLGELRLEALEARTGADLALGKHTDLVSELGELVKQHPLRERLWAQLMVALYRCGRQSDALAAYQAARRLLDEQLGVMPGPELESMQHAVLQHHPSLDPPGAAPTRPALPRPLGEFVGRQRESGELAELLDGHRLVTLTGAAGVGKSRLAVEVARSI